MRILLSRHTICYKCYFLRWRSPVVPNLNGSDGCFLSKFLTLGSKTSGEYAMFWAVLAILTVMFVTLIPVQSQYINMYFLTL